MKRRVLSLTLVLCMLLPLLPAKAFAAEDLPSGCLPGCSLAEGHEGECVSHEARYKTQADGEWVYGPLTDACANVYAGGRVELLRDVDPSSPVEINGPLTLASADPDAPCKIVHTSGSQHEPFGLTVRSNVTLENIVLDGGRTEGRTTHTELVGVYSGTLTLESGAILQNSDNVDTAEGAGGLRVVGGKAVMRPGSAIRNCRAVAGGGAAVANSSATLEMRGGVIEDCEAFLGGGVYVKGGGGLLLTGGSAIRRSQAKETMEGITSGAVSFRGCGGGVFLAGGVVVLQNAVLEENAAGLVGGGIYVYYGLTQLMGGQVTKNHAGSCGGGIGMSPVASVLAGFEPRVIGNTGGEDQKTDNVCLEAALENDGSDPTMPLFVGAAMGENAYIGITRLVAPDEDNPFRVAAKPNSRYEITESDLAKFHSDDPAYVTFLHEKTIVIANADVIFDTQGHGVAPDSQRVGDDHKVKKPVEPSERGYTFGGWYQEADCLTPWNFDTGAIVEDSGEPTVLYARWDLNRYPITYRLDGGVNAADNPDEYTVISPDITLKEPRRVGYHFLGWKEETAEVGTSLLAARLRGEEAEPNIPAGSVGPRVFAAQWAKAEPCTVTYTDGAGGRAFADQAYHECELWSSTPAFVGTPARQGYIFDGWLPEVADEVAGNAVYTAQWTKKSSPPVPSVDPDPEPNPDEEKPPYIPPALESKDHFAYIVGYPDGTVQPEAHISRAETAAVFFRLMTDEFRKANWAEENPFPDVDPDSWYSSAVSTCTRAGLICGFPDGTFGGEKSITRAEFAAIAARFLSEDNAPDSGFSDIENHWAREEIDRAVAAGWIKGLPDGSFRPNAFITRAEVMTLVNRMLGRRTAPDGMLEGMIVWPDNPASAWYYANVQEATNGHTYDRAGVYGPETWTGLTENRDW